MKRIALTGAVLLGSLLSFNLAVAADLSPEEQAAQTVSTRQAVFKLLSFSNAPLGTMARGQTPFDAAVANEALDRIGTLGHMIPALFETDTTSVSGLETRAADTIWSSKADFDQLAADLVAGAEEAKGILASQGEGGLRAAVAAVGPKCGACHDRFRLD